MENKQYYAIIKYPNYFICLGETPEAAFLEGEDKKWDFFETKKSRPRLKPLFVVGDSEFTIAPCSNAFVKRFKSTEATSFYIKRGIICLKEEYDTITSERYIKACAGRAQEIMATCIDKKIFETEQSEQINDAKKIIEQAELDIKNNLNVLDGSVEYTVSEKSEISSAAASAALFVIENEARKMGCLSASYSGYNDSDDPGDWEWEDV